MFYSNWKQLLAWNRLTLSTDQHTVYCCHRHNEGMGRRVCTRWYLHFRMHSHKFAHICDTLMHLSAWSTRLDRSIHIVVDPRTPTRSHSVGCMWDQSTYSTIEDSILMDTTAHIFYWGCLSHRGKDIYPSKIEKLLHQIYIGLAHQYSNLECISFSSWLHSK